jgi:hypothetical protein
MKYYYTIRNADTDKPLGMGGPLERSEVIGRLTAQRKHRLVLSEWYVTRWYGDGGDDDQIEEQISAEEWLREPRGHNV